LREMLSMTFAGGTAPFAGILQLKGGESYIDFANSARISASCGSSRGDPAWDYMDPTSFDVNGGEYPSGNVTVMLRNVPATCVDLPLSKPCAVQPSAYKRPAMFRCKYTSATDPDDPDAEWSPWLHAQRNRVEYDGLATTEIYLTCPLPPFDRFVALSGYKSDAAPASINVTVWHGGRSPYQTSEVVFSGISGGNELTMNGLRAPPPPSPASPPPAPPAPPPPAIQPSCLKWKQSDPSLSGYKIKKISLSSGNTDVLCDFSTSGGGWTRVGLATPQSVGKVNYITSSASNVPSDGVDNGYLGVSYQAGTSYETYMPSNKVGYKLSDADINTLATSVFWGRGINLIKKSYYWNAAQCTNFKSTSSPSDAGCSDPYLSIDNTGTISDRKDCSPYGLHYGLSGWSGACSGGLHFPHSNGYWYIVNNYASHGTKGSSNGYCNNQDGGCEMELWVK